MNEARGVKSMIIMMTKMIVMTKMITIIVMIMMTGPVKDGEAGRKSECTQYQSIVELL